MGALKTVLITIGGILAVLVIISAYLFFSIASAGHSYGEVGPVGLYLGHSGLEYYMFHTPVYSYGQTPGRTLRMLGITDQKSWDVMFNDLRQNGKQPR